MSNNECLDTSTITIPVGPQGATGTAGTDGNDGLDGVDGIFGGFSAKWLFDTSTSSAVPTTKIRFSDTTLSNITSIYVHHNNAATIDHSNFLETFNNEIDNENYYGLVRIWKKGDSNTFFLAKLTSTITNANDTELVVTHIQSNGVFALNDELILNFTPAGEDAEGDKEVFYFNTSVGSTSSQTFSTLSTVAIPENTLVNNGDQLQVNVVIKFELPLSEFGYKVLGTIAGEEIEPIANTPWSIGSGIRTLKIDYTITKKSSTSVRLNLNSYFVNAIHDLVPSWSSVKDIAFTSSVSNQIAFKARNNEGGGGTITLTDFIIKYFNI